jgi:uncharacterized membrane protein YphA (DoxX/SURF4 family)
MPQRSLVRAFLALYIIVGLTVLVGSIETVLAAYHGQIRSPDRVHALVLGSFETVAALVFLIPRTMRAGAAALLVIFLLAFVIHAGRGDAHLDLLVYAAAVLFVRVHGVQGYSWGGGDLTSA